MIENHQFATAPFSILIKCKNIPLFVIIML